MVLPLAKNLLERYIFDGSDVAKFSEMAIRTLYPCIQAAKSFPPPLFIEENEGVKYDSALHEMLHRVSVRVQSTALILQANTRDMVLPLHFPFLENPIDGLVLEGTSRYATHAKLFATSQKLTCLDSMLKKPVLAFHTQRHHKGPLDLEATPAELLSVWGLGNIAYTTVDGNTTCHVEYLEIGRGYLAPVHRSSNSFTYPLL